MASTAIPATLYRITSSQHCRLQAQEAAPCAQFARGQTSGSLCLPSRGAAAAGRGRTGSAISRRRLATVAATGTDVAADAEVDLYGLLGYHPDVNSDPGAADTFIQLSNAYEVLVDANNTHQHTPIHANTHQYTPTHTPVTQPSDKAQTRKGDARQAAAARWSSDSGSEGEGEAVGQVVEAVTGDVVEYPLSAAVRDRFDDGRIKGEPLPLVPSRALSLPLVPSLAHSCPLLPSLSLSCPLLPSLSLSCPLFPSLALSCPLLPTLVLSRVGFVVGRNKGALLPCHAPCLCLFHPATHYFLSASIMVIYLVCTSPLLLAPSSASTSSSSASTSSSSASTSSSSASTFSSSASTSPYSATTTFPCPSNRPWRSPQAPTRAGGDTATESEAAKVVSCNRFDCPHLSALSSASPVAGPFRTPLNPSTSYQNLGLVEIEPQVLNLGLVEIEPLFQEAGENVWQTDALESAAFASLPDLRVLRTVSSPLPAAHCHSVCSAHCSHTPLHPKLSHSAHCALPTQLLLLSAHPSHVSPCSAPVSPLSAPSHPRSPLDMFPSIPPVPRCPAPVLSPFPPLLCTHPSPLLPVAMPPAPPALPPARHQCGQEFDKRTDSWRILDALSPGCGSHVYDEEIIV
ncbi:unnamed protein product [Closterium sp. Naga37s-1]|nr:unnamed protein product [Closterium sp. Naga37s-1]